MKETKLKKIYFKLPKGIKGIKEITGYSESEPSVDFLFEDTETIPVVTNVFDAKQIKAYLDALFGIEG